MGINYVDTHQGGWAVFESKSDIRRKRKAARKLGRVGNSLVGAATPYES